MLLLISMIVIIICWAILTFTKSSEFDFIWIVLFVVSFLIAIGASVGMLAKGKTYRMLAIEQQEIQAAALFFFNLNFKQQWNYLIHQ